MLHRLRFSVATAAILGLALAAGHMASASTDRSLDVREPIDDDGCIGVATASGDCCTTPEGEKLAFHKIAFIKWCSGDCG